MNTLKIPRKYHHLVYGVIQSGVTCAVASGISSYGAVALEQYLAHWFKSWIVSWVIMLPVVVLASPYIRKLANKFTHTD
ncbi:Protein of unknown function DUF2798 [Oxalobacteraceae bacterium]